MAGIADKHFSGFRYPSANQRRVLSRQSALAKQAAGAFGKLIYTKSKRNETPEDGMKLCHEHRSGYAFAGDVTECEIKIRVSGLNNVDVVPAHDAGRLIAIVE